MYTHTKISSSHFFFCTNINKNYDLISCLKKYIWVNLHNRALFYQRLWQDVCEPATAELFRIQHICFCGLEQTNGRFQQSYCSRVGKTGWKQIFHCTPMLPEMVGTALAREPSHSHARLGSLKMPDWLKVS